MRRWQHGDAAAAAAAVALARARVPLTMLVTPP
jgi:hypothetical protein